MFGNVSNHVGASYVQNIHHQPTDSFEKSLNQWVQDAPAGEMRAEAAKEIRRIHELPGGFVKRILELPNFGLTSLPSEIMQMDYLTDLHLQGNSFTHIPDEVLNLPELTTLWINNNKLVTLEGIEKLSKLKDLEILDNPGIRITGDSQLKRLCLPELGFLNGYIVASEHETVNLMSEFESANMNLLAFNLNYNDNDCRYTLGHLKMYLMLAYAKNEMNDATTSQNWACKYSVAINQLLYQGSVLPQDEQFDTIRVQVKTLSDTYLNLPVIKNFAEQADQMGLAAGEAESFIFVTPNGQQGLSVAKACYQKNILNYETDVPNADWITGTLVHQAGNADPEMLSDPATQLTAFPVIYGRYNADMKKAVERLLTTLNMGDYQQKFLSAINNKPTEKMVGEPYESNLRMIFYPLITNTNLGGHPIITDTHFAQILNDFRVLRHSSEEQKAALLFNLSTLFVKYSSSSFFGTAYDSPMPLRSYAAALLTKAQQLFPDLLTKEEAQDYQNRMLGLNGAFSCTDILSEIMISKAKGSTRAMKAAFELVIPQLWR